MSLKTQCSQCRATFSMKSRELEGKKIKCKKCGSPFVVRFRRSSNGSKSSQAGPSQDFPAAETMMNTLPPKVRGMKNKKKKSKPKEEEQNQPTQSPDAKKNQAMLILCSAIGGVVLLVGILFFLNSPSGNASPEPAKLEFTEGTSNQSLFSLEYPSNWKFKTNGGTGGKPEWVNLEGDGVTISIRQTIKGASISDIASGGGQVPTDDLPEDLAPIAKAHDFLKSEVEAEMNSYEEDSPEKIETGMGEGRLSRFVGDRGILGGGTVYGYRATLECSPEQLKVMCECGSESTFKKHQKNLRRIITSIGR